MKIVTLFSTLLLAGSLCSFNGALASSEKINHEEISSEISLGNGVVEKSESEYEYFAKSPFVIETKRLIIAPILTGEMRQEVTKMLISSNPNSLTTLFKFEYDDDFSFEQLMIWFEDIYLAYNGGYEHRFIAYYKGESEFIPVGILALENIEEKSLTGVNTCLYIAETYEKMGLGTELSVAVMQWIVKRTDYSFIETNVLSSNVAASKICKKFGFKKVRTEEGKYLENFTDSSFKNLTESEQTKTIDGILKLRKVDIDYYRLNLR